VVQEAAPPPCNAASHTHACTYRARGPFCMRTGAMHAGGLRACGRRAGVGAMHGMQSLDLPLQLSHRWRRALVGPLCVYEPLREDGSEPLGLVGFSDLTRERARGSRVSRGSRSDAQTIILEQLSIRGCRVEPEVERIAARRAGCRLEKAGGASFSLFDRVDAPVRKGQNRLKALCAQRWRSCCCPGSWLPRAFHAQQGKSQFKRLPLLSVLNHLATKTLHADCAPSFTMQTKIPGCSSAGLAGLCSPPPFRPTPCSSGSLI
jgi:hypothetical protein